MPPSAERMSQLRDKLVQPLPNLLDVRFSVSSASPSVTPQPDPRPFFPTIQEQSSTEVKEIPPATTAESAGVWELGSSQASSVATGLLLPNIKKFTETTTDGATAPTIVFNPPASSSSFMLVQSAPERTKQLSTPARVMGSAVVDVTPMSSTTSATSGRHTAVFDQALSPNVQSAADMPVMPAPLAQNVSGPTMRSETHIMPTESKTIAPLSTSSSSWFAASSMLLPEVVVMQPILRFLQLLCENHNTVMQNMLRHQNRKTNFNLVVDTLQFLDCLCGSTTGGLGLIGFYINEHNVNLINQTLITLTEYCQGPCHENQNQIAMNESNGLDIIVALVLADDASVALAQRSMQHVMELKNNASKLLLAIMESRRDSENAERILHNLSSPKQLIDTAVSAYMQTLQIQLSKTTTEQETSNLPTEHQRQQAKSNEKSELHREPIDRQELSKKQPNIEGTATAARRPSTLPVGNQQNHHGRKSVSITPEDATFSAAVVAADALDDDASSAAANGSLLKARRPGFEEIVRKNMRSMIAPEDIELDSHRVRAAEYDQTGYDNNINGNIIRHRFVSRREEAAEICTTSNDDVDETVGSKNTNWLYNGFHTIKSALRSYQMQKQQFRRIEITEENGDSTDTDEPRKSPAALGFLSNATKAACVSLLRIVYSPLLGADVLSKQQPKLSWNLPPSLRNTNENFNKNRRRSSIFLDAFPRQHAAEDDKPETADTENAGDEERIEQLREVGHNIYILAVQLAEHNEQLRSLIEPANANSDAEAEALEYYREHTSRIELVRSDRSLERIVFPVPQLCKFLTNQTKQRVFQNTKRDDQGSKVTDFVAQVDDMFNEMRWQQQLRKRKVLNWFSRNYAVWNVMAVCLAWLVNSFVATCYPYDDADPAVKLLAATSPHTHAMVSWPWALALAIMVALYMIFSRRAQKLRNVEYFLSLLAFTLLLRAITTVSTTVNILGMLTVINQGLFLAAFVGNHGTFGKTWHQVLRDYESLYQFGYLGVCVLGLVWHPFFYSLLVSVFLCYKTFRIKTCGLN